MFKHIRNADAMIENFSDWEVMEGAMPEKWHVADLDGFMERKGNIWVGEEKSANTPVPVGQQIAHVNMHAAGYATIMVLWYDKEYEYDANGDYILDQHGLRSFRKIYHKMQVYFPGEEPKTTILQPEDEYKIRDVMKRWISHANKHPYVPRKMNGG